MNSKYWMDMKAAATKATIFKVKGNSTNRSEFVESSYVDRQQKQIEKAVVIQPKC